MRCRRQTAVQRWVESIDIAGAGLHQPAPRAGGAAGASSPRCWRTARVRHERGQRRARPVMVEFVSANPTGPLHVGHARQAALGDAICNLFETQGWQVTREFYYNDAGRPDRDARRASVAGRVSTASSRATPGWPAVGLQRRLHRRHRRRLPRPARPCGPTTARSPRRATRRPRRHPRVRGRLPAPRAGPRPAGVRRALRPLLPRVEPVRERPGRRRPCARLVAAGKTYEDGGALWLRTTDYGDDKDRVMRKSGRHATPTSCPTSPTTSTSSSAASRQAINIQGADHHGTIARVRAGLQAAGAACRRAIPTTCCTRWSR